MSNLYILIGNGSSISIVNKINDYRKSKGQPSLKIDLSNLFFMVMLLTFHSPTNLF